MNIFVTNSDDFSNVSIEFLEKYLDWLEMSFIKTKDAKLYWTDEAAAEEYAKVKKYLDNKRIRDEGLALRQEFMDFYKGDNE